MAREPYKAITFDDARYMVANEGFTSKKSIPTGKKAMTKEEILEYLEVDPNIITSYASKRLVPYDKLNGIEWRPTGEYCEQTEQLYIDLNPEEVAVPKAGGTYHINVDANVDWEVVIKNIPNFPTINNTEGTAGQKILDITLHEEIAVYVGTKTQLITVRAKNHDIEAELKITQPTTITTMYGSHIWGYHETSLSGAYMKMQNNQHEIFYTNSSDTKETAVLYELKGGEYRPAKRGYYMSITQYRWWYWTGVSASDMGIYTP